jgi:hypothetical protein
LWNSSSRPQLLSVKLDLMKPRAPANCPRPPSISQRAVSATVPGSGLDARCPEAFVANCNSCSSSLPNVMVPLLFKGAGSRDTQGGFEERQIPGGGLHICGKALRANQGTVHTAYGCTARSKETRFALFRPHFAIESKRVKDLFHHRPHSDTRKTQASTRRLFVTEKTPGSAFARIPASVLSDSLATTPVSVRFPFFTMMWIGGTA